MLQFFASRKKKENFYIGKNYHWNFQEKSYRSLMISPSSWMNTKSLIIIMCVKLVCKTVTRCRSWTHVYIYIGVGGWLKEGFCLHCQAKPPPTRPDPTRFFLCNPSLPQINKPPPTRCATLLSSLFHTCYHSKMCASYWIRLGAVVPDLYWRREEAAAAG